MKGPIKPEEVEKQKIKQIPEKVFEIFNEQIVNKWDGNEAVVDQDKVAGRIAKALKISRQEVFDRNYLDIEDAYREAGWRVKYDSPGYNESFPATFRFRKQVKLVR